MGVQSLLLCIHDTLLCKSTNMWPGILREVKKKKNKVQLISTQPIGVYFFIFFVRE